MIVLLPILWALRTLSYPTSRTTQRWVLILLPIFLINIGAIFSRSSLLSFLTIRFPLLTNLVLGPHLSWLLLLIAILLLNASRHKLSQTQRQNPSMSTDAVSVT